MAIAKTNASNILATVYGRDYIAAYERNSAKFWTQVQRWQGKPAFGNSMTWPIQVRGSHAAAAVAEGGDFPTYTNPSWLSSSETPIQILADVAITDYLGAISQGEGYLGEDGKLAAMLVKQTLKESVLALNRHALGYSSGRIGVVESTTDTSVTVPLRYPEAFYAGREGMSVDFYDTDSGGSKQGASQTVSFVSNAATPAGTGAYITIDAARTLTVGWGVYKAGEYGIAMQGMQHWVDDGTLTSAVAGITRSTNPAINAYVLSSSTGLQPWSEQLVGQALAQVGLRVDEGSEIDGIWSNSGIPAANRDSLAGSRVFTVSTGESVPKFQTGFNVDSMGINYGGKFFPFRVEKNLPARKAFGLTMSLFRKHIVQDLMWTGDGAEPGSGGGGGWLQAPSTTTYSSNKIKLAMAIACIGHLQPKTQFLIKDVVDYELCKDEFA